MKKPKPSHEIAESYKLPKSIRDKLEMEPHVLTIPLVKFCNPVDHVRAIPLITLDQINIAHTYQDIVRQLFELKDLHEDGYQLRAPARDYIAKAHEYCVGNAFKKKFISQAEKVLKENEGYLMQHKLKLSKKRTQQEADLLAVDYTRKAVKNYRGEVLGDQTNMEEGSSSTTDTYYSEGQGSSSSQSGQEQDDSQDENSEPVGVRPRTDAAFTLTKNSKAYTFKPPVSCLVMPHSPKIQGIDSKALVENCALGIATLINKPEYAHTDEMKEFKKNQDYQQENSSLSKINDIMDFLKDVLDCDFNEFVPAVWNHKIHESNDPKVKHFATFIGYTLTDYHCNCKQPMESNSNHERTPFVEYVVPMFKYLAKETNLLGFAWCEKIVETQKYAQIGEVDYVPANVEKKYADGLGKLHNHESLFIESSSGITQENVNHTLEDTLKLICECNGALFYILSQFNKCSFQTALKRSTFGVQIIKNSLTLSKMNLKSNSLWKFVELRSALIPTTWDDRFDWVTMFELLATLYLELIEQERVIMQIRKENSGLIQVATEETLSAHVNIH